MGAKASLLFMAALAITGCSGGLKRFAPPGFVKYEDRAKGIPVTPAIAARIEAQSGTGGGFPKLSDQPASAPAAIALQERAALGDALDAQRSDLLQSVEADRATAAAERLDAIEPQRDALGEALREDDAAARAERGLPPAPPPIKE